ncbi:MAG: hypothetical protein M1838_003630 [Thelocarpon superellum]|nr:MAG: hypothetical protein M1838_003630 [Thelocarpon superellum]
MPQPSDQVNGAKSSRNERLGNRKRQPDATSGSDVDNVASAGDSAQRSELKLASYSEAIGRVAHLASYLGSPAALHDLRQVEKTRQLELRQEKKIHDLKVALDSLAHTKSEETENLRRRNEKLAARQDEAEKAIKHSEAAKIALRDQATAADQARDEKIQQMKDELNKRLKDERARLEERMKTSHAELETKKGKEIGELKFQTATLSETVEQLRRELAAAEETHGLQRRDHERAQKVLEQEVEQLKAEAEFAIDPQSPDTYTDQLAQVARSIHMTALKYFRALPEEAKHDPEETQKRLGGSKAAFVSTPISDSPAAQFLRLANVQQVISTEIRGLIGQPFFANNANSKGDGQMLNDISERLSTSSRRSESIWRSLTLQGLSSSEPSGEINAETLAVENIVAKLAPLVTPSELPRLKEDLFQVTRQALHVWRMLRTDSCRISIDPHPQNPGWRLYYEPEIEANLGTTDATRSSRDTDMPSVCLFPRVIGDFEGQNEPTVLYPGLALFPNHPAFAQGAHEQEEFDQAFKTVKREVVARVASKRLSISSPNVEFRNPTWQSAAVAYN